MPTAARLCTTGILVYVFSKDKASADVNGEGINAFGGTWHAATPSLTAM
jgi:predicted lipoprotein with Yx(FWY)xxD motif